MIEEGISEIKVEDTCVLYMQEEGYYSKLKFQRITTTTEITFFACFIFCEDEYFVAPRQEL